MTSPPNLAISGSTLSGVERWTRTITRGAAGLQLRAEVLHEVVVHADVGERAGGGAGRRADRHAEQRDEEDQADQAAPQRAAGGARGGELVGLVQLDLAVLRRG